MVCQYITVLILIIDSREESKYLLVCVILYGLKSQAILLRWL